MEPTAEQETEEQEHVIEQVYLGLEPYVLIRLELEKNSDEMDISIKFGGGVTKDMLHPILADLAEELSK